MFVCGYAKNALKAKSLSESILKNISRNRQKKRVSAQTNLAVFPFLNVTTIVL